MSLGANPSGLEQESLQRTVGSFIPMDELRKTEALVFLCPGPTITRWVEGQKQVRLTREFIHAAKSDAGGWNRKQLKVVGIDWPPRKGWIQRLEGVEISEEQARKFVEFRNQGFVNWFSRSMENDDVR